MNRHGWIIGLVTLLSHNQITAQVNEGFEGATFPPQGWTASASSGTTQWTRITSNTRNTSSGAASSSNPAAGVSRYLTLSMNTSSGLLSMKFYCSVSSVTTGTGASLKVYGGTDTTALTLLRTMNLEDSNIFSANTYVQVILNIDGTLASGQTGAVNLRSQNPAYIRWSHQKSSGTAASCRLEDLEIQNAIPLPVQLTAFTAAIRPGEVWLRWSTATELYNYGFEIQRQGDDNGNVPGANGSTWNTIGFVQGHGTCFTPKEYAFTDKPISSGHYAYRLRQIDYDGTVEYYGPIEIRINRTRNTLWLSECFPNPCNPSTVMSFSLPVSAHAEVRVYDNLGRTVTTLFDGPAAAGRVEQVRFDASQCPSGLYIVRLISGGYYQQNKILVLK